MDRYVIIVAGGKGLRMGGDLPKQFLLLEGKPVLQRTLERFRSFDPSLRMVVVLPKEQQAYWQELCRTHACTVEHTVTDGGETRFHSVKNGLAHIQAPAVVGVHDGVRPFVSVDVIRRCYELAERWQAVVPVVEVVDTLRCVDSDGSSKTVNRSDYRLVQTPQVFDAALLKRAYEQDYSSLFTDDASVVEAMGVPVHLTEGNRENIKLTTPFDWQVAKALQACST